MKKTIILISLIIGSLACNAQQVWDTANVQTSVGRVLNTHLEINGSWHVFDTNTNWCKRKGLQQPIVVISKSWLFPLTETAIQIQEDVLDSVYEYTQRIYNH